MKKFLNNFTLIGENLKKIENTAFNIYKKQKEGKKGKKGQLSLEFSVMVLAILVISYAMTSHFMDEVLDQQVKKVGDVDVLAKSAVNLLNSGYNGSEASLYFIRSEIINREGQYDITIVLANDTPVSENDKNFLKDYIEDNVSADTTVALKFEN
uniref:Class III signal peptide-containing protein n=1 Tax=Methanococcus voltae (strain ATCC BAA-1334 / A3) TaxID=456320 RepID=D7DUR6_METV3